MRRAVFLDRDGVLNRAIVRNGRLHAPTRPSEFEILPRVAESCAILKREQFVLIVVTNQPDVSRGKVSRATVEEMNRELLAKLPLDEIRVCYHDDVHRCGCRKPAPGLLIAAARDHDVALERSFMIGDRWQDIEAGGRAGCRTVLVDDGTAQAGSSHPNWRVRSLWEATEVILANS